MMRSRRFRKIVLLFDIYAHTGGEPLGTWEERFREWNESDKLSGNLKQQLNEIQSNKVALEDAFYEELTFGTGGMRGILGPGTNRMNIYTVRRAVKGLAYYVEETCVNYKDRGVVIAYDSRHLSKEFALECAKVLGVHGIKAYIFDSIRPTPLLSYAVRYLGAVAGIMITASHNPPEYNGFKVYNESGSQVSLAEANEMIDHIQQVGDAFAVPVLNEEQLITENLLQWIENEVDHAYLEQLLKISKLDQDKIEQAKDVSIVFTPLHGTAQRLVPAGLKQLHFHQVAVVEEQMIPDPEFTTVESPNPEEHQAFKEAIKVGKEIDADVLLATDPDADRLGVAVKDGTGDYVVLTGNQLGALLLDYILKHTHENILPCARMIKTIVTSELGRKVADNYGVKTIDTLTGFKYIGAKINEFDATGESFVFGYEESYGYLINGFTRDKDAVQSAVMACEMAQYWKNKGYTLLDALYLLYERHGFYKEGLSSLTLEGKVGQQQIAEIVELFRTEQKTHIGSLATKYIEDYKDGERVYMNKGKQKESLSLPEENVVKYVLEDNSWICLRPSGTEPKLKWYYGTCGETEAIANEKLIALENAMHRLIVQPLELTK